LKNLNSKNHIVIDIRKNVVEVEKDISESMTACNSPFVKKREVKVLEKAIDKIN